MGVNSFFKNLFFSGSGIETKDVGISNTSENPYMPEVEYNFMATMEQLGLEYLPTGTDFHDFVKSCLRDPDIATELNNFKAKVEKARLEIVPANDSTKAEEAAAMCEYLLNQPLINNYQKKTLRCMEQGFSVTWLKMEKGESSEYPFSIDKFQEPNYESFSFNEDGTLLRVDNLQELPQPFWIITSFDERQENRWGISIFSTLYWVLKFSKVSYKQIMVLQDKLGVPSFAALFEGGDDIVEDRKRIKEMATTLSNVRSHSGIALTADSIVKLEAQRGAISEIISFMRYMEEKKTKVIMGSLLTSGTSNTGGTYNLAENHAEITMDRAQTVANLLAETLTNQVIPILCRYNISFDFSVQDMPTASFIIDKVASLDNLIKVGEKLPVKVKASTLKKFYNLPIVNEDDEELEFSAPTQTPITELSSSKLADVFFSQKIQKKAMKITQEKTTTS